jgi:hypothetical protein
MQGQQGLDELAGPVSRSSIFSRLKNGQSSSSGVNQGQVIPSKAPTLQSLRKAPMQQIYEPKKVETHIIPPPRARPQSVITISSMEASVTNHGANYN